MSFEQQQQRNQQGGVDDLANRLNQMNVYSSVQQEQQQQHYCHSSTTRLAGSDLTNIQKQQQQSNLVSSQDDDMDISEDYIAQENQDRQRLSSSFEQQQQQQQQLQYQQPDQNKSGNILIVTNVDSSVFSDKLTQAKFESLFLAYDHQITFRYLKSFRRVRLDFTDPQKAELARQNRSSFKIGDTICKSYIAQMIRPQSQLAPAQQQQQQQQHQQDNLTSSNYGNNLNECYLSTNHLNIPKLTKQFLISPPASPPVGWEPVNEGSPCIDVQLLSAMANLVPGKVHEIHQGNESQPGIYVEVCEDPQFPAGSKRCHIPKTPLPVKTSF